MYCPDNPVIRQMELTGEYHEPIVHGWDFWKGDDEDDQIPVYARYTRTGDADKPRRTHQL